VVLNLCRPLLIRLYPRLSEGYNALRGGVYRRENANLYERGVNEEAAASYSTPLRCSSFWMFSAKDGMRSYLVRYLEGVDDAMEEEDE
jgi:hypothetical protein